MKNESGIDAAASPPAPAGLSGIRDASLFCIAVSLAASAGIGLALAAGEVVRNAYLSQGLYHTAWAVTADLLARWTGTILSWLAPALLASWAGGAWVLRRRAIRARIPARAQPRWIASFALGLLVFLFVGYRINRLEFGLEWKTMRTLLGVPVPEALLLPRAIVSNLLITLGAAAIAFTAYRISGVFDLFRRLARVRAVAIAMVPIVAVHAVVFATALRARRDLPNVVLVTVDTFRADRFGAVDAFGPLTPNLDRLAARGVRFERAYSTSPWTLPSMASIMTGLYPAEHGAQDFNRKIASERITLAERLRDRGYETGAIVFSAYVDPIYGFDQGFGSYRHFGNKMRRNAVSSERIADLAVDWIRENRGRPFFLFVHFFDPHYNYISHGKTDLTTYDGPVVSNHDIYELREIQDSLGAEDLAVLRSFYDEEVQFTDRHIGWILDAIDRLGIADRTIVAFTSDHGEEFREHGWIGHTRNLFEGMVRVPLVIVDPRESFARPVVSQPVENRRLPATILDLLSLRSSPGGIAGESLRPLMEGGPEDPSSPVFAEVLFSREDKRSMKQAVVRGGWKLVFDLDAGTFELFDLEADPGETADLAAFRPDMLEAMKALLVDWVGRMDAARGTAGDVNRMELDDTTRERLRAMGYLR